MKKRSNIINKGFFEEDGISRNIFYIFFVALLICIQIGISAKTKSTIIEIDQLKNELRSIENIYMSTKHEFAKYESPSEIQKKVSFTGLYPQLILPLVIEYNQ